MPAAAFATLPSGSISDSTRADLDAIGPDWPDYEIFSLDWAGGNDSISNRNYASILATLTNPFSRGNVTIRFNDTGLHPVVSPNWLVDRRDQEVAVAAFKQARAVFTNNSATAPIVIGSEVFPGLNVSTDAQILEFIQQNAATDWHPSCTCAMGLANNPMAVLDSKARVYGVKGLRVVDASAFPVLPPGHPSATVCE